MTNTKMQDVEKKTPANGKSILMVVAPEGYRDEELNEPRKVFREVGYKVTVASKGTNDARGMLGGSTTVDIDISNVKVEEYDAIVFVGGTGASIYFNDQVVLKLVKDAVIERKVIGAICIAPSILANAEILHGKNATSFYSEADNLRSKGATYTGDLVTVDDKIVTAKGPEAAKEFANKIVEVLTQR